MVLAEVVQSSRNNKIVIALSQRMIFVPRAYVRVYMRARARVCVCVCMYVYIYIYIYIYIFAKRAARDGGEASTRVRPREISAFR